MSLRRILGLLSLTLTALCLGIGFVTIGPGAVFAAVLLTLLVWLLAYKWPSTWLSTAALVLTVGLAAVGLLAGAVAYLMLLGVIFALANWDLAFLELVLAGNSSKTVTLLEKKHYQSLALALGLTLLVTFTGRMIRFQIPFIGLMLLVALAIFGLGRVWRLFSE
jgi:hypothetical protein